MEEEKITEKNEINFLVAENNEKKNLMRIFTLCVLSGWFEVEPL